MPSSEFAIRKAENDLRLGVPNDADAWITEKQRELDFKLKKLGYEARTGKLVGVRLVNGILSIANKRTKVPKAKVEAAKWLILDRMPQIDITDLLTEIDAWRGQSVRFPLNNAKARLSYQRVGMGAAPPWRFTSQEAFRTRTLSRVPRMR